MRPGGGRLAGYVAPTPPVSGVKHGLEPVGPPLSKLAKTGGLDTEPGREPVQLSPDDSKALDFDEPKIKAILGKQRSPSGSTRYLVKWEGRDGAASYTWSPAQTLAGCIEILIRFEEERAERAWTVPVMEAMKAEEAEIPVADAVVRAMAVRCSAAEEQAASAMARVGALEGELSRAAAAERRWAAAEQSWKAEVASAGRRAEDARASAEAACAYAAALAHMAASATAKVGALEDERSRAAAAERRWAAAEQTWKGEGTVSSPRRASLRPPARPLKPPPAPRPQRRRGRWRRG